MFSFESERQAIADLVGETCKRYGFDGIVLEVWSQLAGRVEDTYLLRLVEDIGLFHKFSKTLQTQSLC